MSCGLHLRIGFDAVEVDHGGRLTAIGNVWTIVVAEGDPAPDASLRSGFPGVPADAFILRRPPQALDEDIVEAAAFSNGRPDGSSVGALYILRASSGKVMREFLPISDNAPVFTSRRYTTLVRSCGLKQEFITPHCQQQDGMVERVIRTLKEQWIRRQRFDSIKHATRAIGDWISFCNTRRPRQATDMNSPAGAFALTA